MLLECMKTSTLAFLSACLLFASANASGQCVRNTEKLPPGTLDGPGSFGPLQDTVTLDCLKFKGVSYHGKELVAVLEDERGKSYRVKRGDNVGEKSGYLTEITSNRLTITQIVPDGRGGWIEQKRYIGRTR